MGFGWQRVSRDGAGAGADPCSLSCSICRMVQQQQREAAAQEQRQRAEDEKSAEQKEEEELRKVGRGQVVGGQPAVVGLLGLRTSAFPRVTSLTLALHPTSSAGARLG